MKKAFLLFLAIAMLLSTGATAFAADTSGNIVVTPRYAYIATHAEGLTIDKDTGIANSYAQCSAPMYTVEIECTLRRYVGAIWTPLKTWTASNASLAVVDEDWKVYNGSNYRIDVTYRVYNASGALLETASVTRYCAYPAS